MLLPNMALLYFHFQLELLPPPQLESNVEFVARCHKDLLQLDVNLFI